MSGGVDSSVATSLLREQGFDVVGSMLRFWPDERPAGAFDLCCSPTAAFDARRMADRIDIPFYLLDYREAFDRVVIEPFVPEYEAGTTPNPCVWCNREIKFGSMVKRAQALGCEFMATGHYVRRVDGPGGAELHRGLDDDKDQTYFLWALPRELLPYLLFPLGELTKEQVRELARERGFSTADKASSSGLCFIATTVKDYLRDNTEAKPGPVLDAADGFAEVGRHDGIQYFTIGQRKGLGVTYSEPLYVLATNPYRNALVVGTRDQLGRDWLTAKRMNWISGSAPTTSSRAEVKIRYKARAVPAWVEPLDEDRIAVRFDEPLRDIAAGQGAVIYDGDVCLGGGIIERPAQDDGISAQE